MRSSKYLPFTLLFILMTLLTVPPVVRADDDNNDDNDEVSARVMRVSLLSGEVNLRRAGGKEWERATLNLPLVEGDTLTTNREARLEIQVDARNFVRVGADSVLRIVTLRDEGIALSLVEGTATVRLARFDHDHEYFEVDAPNTTLAAETPGLYRLDVSHEGRVRLTASDGGRARIYSETSSFTLRDGKSAELSVDGADAGDWELSVAPALDDWDRWVNEREHYLEARLHAKNHYYDETVWGAEELDAYGDWDNTSDYGWVWHPHVTVINNYNNWAPYRYGNWRWCEPYGWTWVGDEPWGWAPYHYGRWVYYNNNWCWTPRSYQEHRTHWRPALVAFVNLNINIGNSRGYNRDRDRDHDHRVAWYPLGYRQPDPRGKQYLRYPNDRITPRLRADELGELHGVHPAYLRAVSVARQSEFGRYNAHPQPANEDLARRALNGQPIRGRLPFKPIEGGSDTAERVHMRSPIETSREASGIPARQMPEERRTGAATRQPGVPLDNELRRTRLYNGRDPRSIIRPNTEATGESNERSTGAVTRPPRPNARPLIERAKEGEANNTGNAEGERIAVPSRRTPRPARSESTENIPSSSDDNERPASNEVRPARQPRPTVRNEDLPAPRTERIEHPERAARPERVEQPARVERPERAERHERIERSAPVERTERPERSEQPREREARPERTEAPPPQTEHRPEAQPESKPERPASRPEPSRPEPSHSEPTHSEAPHSEAPHHEQPESHPAPRAEHEAQPEHPSRPPGKESPDQKDEG